MRITTPGVEFYAQRVRDSDPFTLIRYGEGELRLAVPSLPAKGSGSQRIRGLRYMRESAKIWAREANREAFRETVVGLHRHPRYFPALWHLNIMHKCGWLDDIEGWLNKVGLGDVEWHDGWVWRIAVEKQRLGIMMGAIRTQPLPIVVVAPERMRSIEGKLPIAKFVISPIPSSPPDVPTMMEGVLEVEGPALVILCAGVAGKILTHRLFPQIGEHSFLIDFGATLDGMCGNRVRGYHGPKALTKEAIKRNWGVG